MIAKLRGRLDEKNDDAVIVDVGGVGYLVFCSARTLQDLPGTGEAVEMYVETHVREDHINLYGFLSPADRQWFRLLLTVQGVGTKVALALLSALSPSALLQAIAAQDKASVARTPGIGPRLAQRIVTELKDKAANLGVMAVPAGSKAAPSGGATPAAGAPTAEGADAEALSALANLGYGRSEAFTAVGHARAALGEDAGVEAIIRQALRELAKD